MEAMDKIRDEMAGSKNPGVQTIGEAMTALLMAAPELSPKVLAEGKTLAGAFKAVEEYAKNHKTGNCAYVPPAKAAELVAAYWDIDVAAMKRAVLAAALEAMGEEPQAQPAPTAAPAIGQQTGHGLADALDLDALLGGL